MNSPKSHCKDCRYASTSSVKGIWWCAKQGTVPNVGRCKLLKQKESK